MLEPQGERITRVEAQLAEVRGELDSHLVDARARSDRMRELERAVGMLIDVHKDARRREETQYRRLELRVQWLSVSIAFAALVLAITIAVTHH